MNQIQKSIDNLTNKDKELSIQVKLLMESSVESEKSQKHITETSSTGKTELSRNKPQSCKRSTRKIT